MFNKIKSIKNSKNFLRNISIIIFWGSLWGIVEATLGYFLHRINFSFGWCIWFPIAFYFMDKIYRKTGKAQCMLYGAFITASIKLTNMFIEPRIDKVLNPAISIILEAVALVIFYKVLEKKQKKANIIGVGVLNLSWRCLYDIYLLFMPQSILAVSVLRGWQPFLKFMILESLVNTIIIAMYLILREKLITKTTQESTRNFATKPVISALMLALAVFIQIYI